MISLLCQIETRNAILEITKNAEGNHCLKNANVFHGSLDIFRFQNIAKYICFSPQEGPLCSPEGRDCIESSSEETFSCPVPCEGLYADVTKLQLPENSQYDKIKEEYLNYKRSFLGHVRFNASAKSTFFSEYICNSLCRTFFFQPNTSRVHLWSLSTSSSTRPPSTRSRGTRRSSLKASSVWSEGPWDSSLDSQSSVASRFFTLVPSLWQASSNPKHRAPEYWQNQMSKTQYFS